MSYLHRWVSTGPKWLNLLSSFLAPSGCVGCPNKHVTLGKLVLGSREILAYPLPTLKLNSLSFLKEGLGAWLQIYLLFSFVVF